MLHKIGIEEHFGVPDTAAGSDVYFTGSRAGGGARLMDIIDSRIIEMDANGMDMMVLSLNSPAIQEIYDVNRAVDVAKKANDILANSVEKRKDRFRGFGALPLQDPDEAIKELHRCINELGFLGVLVNGYSQIGTEDNYVYLDDPRYRPFWAEIEKLDVPFYLHPREPMKVNTEYIKEHFWLHGAAWAFTVETASHALRLMCSGLFDEFPNLKVILGHMGEGLPFTLWRTAHMLSIRTRGMPAKRNLMEYFDQNFYVTTSGQFNTPALVCTMLQMGSDKIMFATDYPFETVPDACKWFDACPISEPDRLKIGRTNITKLLKLDV